MDDVERIKVDKIKEELRKQKLGVTATKTEYLVARLVGTIKNNITIFYIDNNRNGEAWCISEWESSSLTKSATPFPKPNNPEICRDLWEGVNYWNVELVEAEEDKEEGLEVIYTKEEQSNGDGSGICPLDKRWSQAIIFGEIQIGWEKRPSWLAELITSSQGQG